MTEVDHSQHQGHVDHAEHGHEGHGGHHDHVGRFLGPVTAESDSVRSLVRLLDAGSCWIKISAPYESSRSGPPGYDDIAWIARLVAERYPDRCLWASNWPHPNRHPPPSDASMLDWALGCIDSTAARRKVLVDNPAELYGFAP
jgi:D-galactarolactone isomerase